MSTRQSKKIDRAWLTVDVPVVLDEVEVWVLCRPVKVRPSPNSCYKVRNKLLFKISYTLIWISFRFPLWEGLKRRRKWIEGLETEIKTDGRGHIRRGWLSLWLHRLRSNWYRLFISYFFAHCKRRKREIKPKYYPWCPANIWTPKWWTDRPTKQATLQSTENCSHCSRPWDTRFISISCFLRVLKNLRVSPGITTELKLRDNLSYLKVIQFIWEEEGERASVSVLETGRETLSEIQ